MYKKNNYYKKNPYSNTKPNNHVYVKKFAPIEKSDEEGFTGKTDEWFDEELFQKKLNFTNDPSKDYYFSSYGTFHIHEEMIKDRIRTGTYKNAIENNPDTFKDKVVLDIGCGTGILSMFAARAGAKHVYGIEFADIADYAKEIVKVNNLSERITIIKSKAEEAELPEKVDIIISEWMGYFLLYESMLDTVLYARDKWLKPDGIILPDRAVMNIASIEDEQYKSSKVNFWDNVYGFKMTPIKPTVFSEPLIDTCEKNAINSNVCRILELDLYKCTKEDLDFSNKYELTMLRYDTVHAFISWFDIYFDKLPNKAYFTTGPYNKYTHWKQTIFYLEKDLYVYKGDIITGSIASKKATKNPRELDIKISSHLINKEGKFDQVQQFKLK